MSKEQTTSQRKPSSKARLWLMYGFGFLLILFALLFYFIYPNRNNLFIVKHFKGLKGQVYLEQGSLLGVVSKSREKRLRLELDEKWFAMLENINAIDMKHTTVTDNDLIHLQPLRHLEGLSLENTRVTDVGLHHIKGLTSLEILKLSHTDVTDAGLLQLQGLTYLEEIHLQSTNVTELGVDRIQKPIL